MYWILARWIKQEVRIEILAILLLFKVRFSLNLKNKRKTTIPTRANLVFFWTFYGVIQYQNIVLLFLFVNQPQLSVVKCHSIYMSQIETIIRCCSISSYPVLKKGDAKCCQKKNKLMCMLCSPVSSPLLVKHWRLNERVNVK